MMLRVVLLVPIVIGQETELLRRQIADRVAESIWHHEAVEDNRQIAVVATWEAEAKA